MGSRRNARRARALAMVLAITAVGVMPGGGAADDPTVVQTSQGTVQGIVNPDAAALEWRGIPYAQAPVGSLRWRPPVPATPWSGVLDASEFGSPCIQIDFAGGTLGSEDCLFLNVFTPSGASGPLPVMVHLHGGGNFAGWGYEDAHALTRHDVVVVTLNYRLGILGFAGAPALTAEGSLPEAGMLDQVAALRWVRDNIAAFGGDPSNVTIFGLSAGSFDAVALTASPLAAGLVHRAAIEGDAFWPTTGIGNSLADKEQIGREIGEGHGCGASPSTACLRSLAAETLVLAADVFDSGPLVGGAVLPRSALAVYQERGASVPLLIGSNREEATWFLGVEPISKSNFTRNVTDLVGPSRTAAATRLYPTSFYGSLRWALNTLGTDAVYTCPTRRLAVAASSKGATYRYLFTHVLENDPFLAQFRASHAFENIFLWEEDWYAFSPDEAVLSFTMATYWTNFAKTGDPNVPAAGLPTWPRYDTTREEYLALDTPVGQGAAYHVRECALMDTIEPFGTCTSLCRFYTYARWWHRRE